jgi:hypothetical protein
MIHDLNAHFLSTKNKDNAATFMVRCWLIYFQTSFYLHTSYWTWVQTNEREHQPQYIHMNGIFLYDIHYNWNIFRCIHVCIQTNTNIVSVFRTVHTYVHTHKSHIRTYIEKNTNIVLVFLTIHTQTRRRKGCQMVSFQTKNTNLGKFWRALKWKLLLYIPVIWNILRPWDIFNRHLVFW